MTQKIKASYLYVNVYTHPVYGHLLYAGSCTRKDNVRGLLNASYHGSSSIVKLLSWDKYLVRTLYVKDTTGLNTRNEFKEIRVVGHVSVPHQKSQ